MPRAPMEPSKATPRRGAHHSANPWPVRHGPSPLRRPARSVMANALSTWRSVVDGLSSGGVAEWLKATVC
jgi:hypothetical protein